VRDELRGLSITAVAVASRIVLQTGGTNAATTEAAEAAAKAFRSVLNPVVEAALGIGLALGLIGVVFMILSGVFKVNVMGMWGRTEGIRAIIHACEALIAVPMLIGILWLLDQLALAKAFGPALTNETMKLATGEVVQAPDTTTTGGLIHAIWLYIYERLAMLRKYLFGV